MQYNTKANPLLTASVCNQGSGEENDRRAGADNKEAVANRLIGMDTGQHTLNKVAFSQ